MSNEISARKCGFWGFSFFKVYADTSILKSNLAFLFSFCLIKIQQELANIELSEGKKMSVMLYEYVSVGKINFNFRKL